jgi:dolichol-phosphate mannosyltransferase
MKYSVVIPVHNEAESIRLLIGELRPILSTLDGESEILIINDGSTDGTAQEVNSLASEMKEVRCFHLRKRSGKSVGYSVGFTESTGELLITLDGDLQDDPAEIPKLLKKLEEGFDLVVGMKGNRVETEITRKIPSIAFNYLLYLCFGLKLRDSNSGFRALKRNVAEALSLYGDRYRFIPQLAHVNGFRVAEQEITHRRRQYGSSKYGLTRFYTGFCDLIAVRFIVGFHRKPLQFFGALGLLPLLLGVGLEVRVLVCKALGDPFRMHIAALVSGVFLLLIAMQTFSLGLLGELLASQKPKTPPPTLLDKCED